MRLEDQEYLKVTLLRGECEIWEIPFKLRIQNISFYIMAFRSKRDRRQAAEYQRVLKLLRQDILTIHLLGGYVGQLASVYWAYNAEGYMYPSFDSPQPSTCIDPLDLVHFDSGVDTTGKN